MKYLSINEVKSGDILAMTVFGNECQILLYANETITANNIKRLKALGFQGLYVYEEGCKDIHKELLSDDIRQKALKSLKHINIDDCLYIANTITNKILENPNILYELRTVCSYDNRTYIHCINVAVLSVMMGIDMEMDNETLYELSQSALLHDIGKTCIDEKILNKTDRLTIEEYETMKRHADYGYNMLLHNNNISDNVRNGVRFHHENEDGSGYPLGLKAKEIPLIAKIIHVADVYDAMVSERSYKRKINPADVLEYMMGHTDIFSLTIVKSLIQCAVLYPIGTKVTLSDKTTGIILNNVKGYPHRPEIKLYNGQKIKLMETLNITIISLNN